MSEWKYWTPERDGHAPNDWVEGLATEYENDGWWTGTKPAWFGGVLYRYSATQDATHEPDLLAQCLALPQADRDALIEALQKPQRDWADQLFRDVIEASGYNGGMDAAELDKKDYAAIAVIRSMCRPKAMVIANDHLRAVGEKYGLRSETIGNIVKEALSDE